MKLEERIKGAIIGIAYGDAFGMPSEMWSPEKIRREFGVVTSFLPGHQDNEISRGFQAGEVTDDTKNTVFVIEMLEENHGEVQAMDFIRRLKDWSAKEEKSRTVIGPSTAAAFEKLERGESIETTGKNGVTNGGAMKILPVGLVNYQKPLEELMEQVHALCKPTHNTSCAIAGAGAVAAAGAMALRGESSLFKILQYAKQAAKLGEEKGFPVCSPSVKRRIEIGEQIVGQDKPWEEILKDLYEVIGTGLGAAESVPAALSLVLLAKGEPQKCARYAANIGGDTDTIGAMACGICGAFSGEKAFEKEEVELLERVNQLSFEKLSEKLLQGIRRENQSRECSCGKK